MFPFKTKCIKMFISLLSTKITSSFTIQRKCEHLLTSSRYSGWGRWGGVSAKMLAKKSITRISSFLIRIFDICVALYHHDFCLSVICYKIQNTFKSDVDYCVYYGLFCSLVLVVQGLFFMYSHLNFFFLHFLTP